MKEVSPLSTQHFGAAYGANPAENYERYFVPAIGKPLADDLIASAALEPGERVLDVACGTGVVARLAAQAVGSPGSVAGLDVNPGMLAVARSATPPETSIEWYEASAEAIPLSDEAFDVVLCQLGLQFVPDPLGALREMRRVLVEGGRLIVTAPGPTNGVFARLAEELERHVGGHAAGFVRQVFALHDAAELRAMLSDAGLRDVAVEAHTKTLRLPESKEFLWQYVHGTPLVGLVAKATDQARAALERDVVAAWQEFEQDGVLVDDVRVVVGSARK